MEITEEMLSPSAKQFLLKNGTKLGTQIRLAPTVYPKSEYVTHIRNLKFYMQQGLVLKKIRRGIIFKQSQWLKPYIVLNTQKRILATSAFEKEFFKLLINSIYGK